MIRGIHYFSAEVKPKLMSSQGAALIINFTVIKIVINTMLIYPLKTIKKHTSGSKLSLLSPVLVDGSSHT